jgi:hypothetical protein
MGYVGNSMYAYAKWVVLSISVPEGQNCTTTFGGSPPYRIPATSVKRAMKYVEKFICVVAFITNRYG